MNTKTKIVKLPILKEKISQLRKQGYKIAFTNGCFDILHLGHISYLQNAKKAGRILVVGLNSDQSVKKIKGSHRPIVDEKARAAVLAALACIDYVTVFNEETPLRLIETLKPDVLIKGADWKRKGVVGSECVRAHGGKVEHAKYISGMSSTNIIDRILNTLGKHKIPGSAKNR